VQALSELAEARYPLYAQADITVDVGSGSHAQAVDAIVAALDRFTQDAST
jgi:shikimate kinase